MRAPQGSHKNAIIELCKKEGGATMAEIAQCIDRSSKVATAVMVPLIKNGVIHKAGIKQFYHYFTDPLAAAEFEKVAPDLYAQHQEEQKERVRASNRAYYHANREKFRAKDRARYQVKVKSKPAKEHRKPEIVLTKKSRNVTDKLQAVPEATVTWPEHVKVQKLPCGRDTRFTFDPPPGWRGAITEDWMNQRLAQA